MSSKSVLVTVTKGEYPGGGEIQKPISKVVQEVDLAGFFRREEVFSMAKNKVKIQSL